MSAAFQVRLDGHRTDFDTIEAAVEYKLQYGGHIYRRAGKLYRGLSVREQLLAENQQYQAS